MTKPRQKRSLQIFLIFLFLFSNFFSVLEAQQPDPYKRGKSGSVLIHIGARGDGSYGLTGWNYDTQKVENSYVITKTYKTIEAGEYVWTTENLRLKYGRYGSVDMNWVNLTQADVDKFANEYLNGQSIPLEEFEEIFGTWSTLYDVAMMYRNIYWGVPDGNGGNDHTWGLPSKDDIWQLYGLAPRTSGNVYEDIKDFLFASACDNKYGWAQNMFNRRNISGLTLTPLGMRESYNGGAVYGFGQVAALQISEWAKIEILADRDLSGKSGILSDPYSYHFTQARHRRPLTDKELGYKLYIDTANDKILMLSDAQPSSLPELPKGLERGIALRYMNQTAMKVLKSWSEIQTEATEIRSKLAPTNYPTPPALLPCEPEPEPEITPDPYEKGKERTVLINIGAKGDGSYGMTGWNYDLQKVENSYVITKTYKTIEASEYEWTTENLRLKYGRYGSIDMNWVNLTQADVDKFSADYLNGRSVPLDEFEQVYGTWATLYDVAMMYRNIYWGVPNGDGTFDHTWSLPSKEDIWQLYGQAPRKSNNLYNDIKDFLFASSTDFNFGWSSGLFNHKNISGLTLTPLGMRESYNGGAVYGFNQVTSLQTSTWAAIETMADRDLSGQSGLISNPYSYHFTQARHRRPLTDKELGYKLYVNTCTDEVMMVPSENSIKQSKLLKKSERNITLREANQNITLRSNKSNEIQLPELPKGLERGIALRYTNRKNMKILKRWSEIQAEAKLFREEIQGITEMPSFPPTECNPGESLETRSLKIGFAMALEIYDGDGNKLDLDVTWVSSNPQVGRVENNNTLRILSEGTMILSIIWEDGVKEDLLRIIVIDDEELETDDYIDGITINNDNIDPSGTILDSFVVEYIHDARGNRIEKKTILLTLRSDVLTDESFTDDTFGNKVIIYPNPTKGKLDIDLSSLGDKQEGQVHIFNMRGQAVGKKRINTNTLSFDLSSSPNGVYILVLEIGKKKSTWKIIKE